ncbi:hypothetical protein PG989_015959 [Apiospora arundinis]
MPRTNLRMARLSKENSTQDVMARKDTPPGSPVAGVGTGTGTDGGSRTYSQYTLSRESSSIFMQSRLHQNYSRPLSASSCQQPQQQPTRIQQMLQSSRPSSRRNSSGNKPTVDSSSRPTPLPFDHANPDDKRTVDGDEKKTEEEEVVEEEGRREDHLEQQGEQQPPISTATAASPTRTPSPLLTLFPASETSSSSPIISPTSSGQQKAKRTTRLSPPLYLNETNLETMTTAEALAAFLDHPVLHTNQDFIEAVAWKEDDAWSGNSTSRSFIVVDEDAEVRKQQKSRNSVVAKKKNKKQKMAEEDYELQHWDYSSTKETECAVPVEATTPTLGESWENGVTRTNFRNFFPPGVIF